MILPTNRQIQIIADSLSNPAALPRIDPAQLTSPWRDFHAWIHEWILKDPDDIEPQKLRCDFVSSHGKYGHASFVPMTADSISGSSHIAAMARHIWGLQFVTSGPNPDLSDPRSLWVVKTKPAGARQPV